MMKLPGFFLAACMLAVAPASADPAGLYCTDGGSSFMIGRSVQDDGFELRITSWQGMFHCGIEGVTSPTEGGWLLERQGCEVRLREDGDAIVLAASPREACAPFCGSRGSLDGLSFPNSGRSTQDPDPSLFERDLGEMNPC